MRTCTLPRLLSVALAAATLLACGDSQPPESRAAATPAGGVSGVAPPVSEGIPSVVTLQSSDEESSPAPTGVALMDQLGLTFLPTQLMVRMGQTLRFTNSETLAHNVHLRFVDNDSSVFYADMNPGDRTEVVLEREGGYDVTCDEHPGMRAFVYVTSSPYATFAEADGSFALPDVPPGAYTARLWSASPELRGELTVDVSPAGAELDLTGLE